MKEIHLFYAPEIEQTQQLPQDESVHAVKVLRLTEGDRLLVCDGRGTFFEAEVTIASQKRCGVRILHKYAETPVWKSTIHIAVAPTKNMDRMEWFAEKATEVGVDHFSFLDCANSERRVLKHERIEKTVVSAMKQSHKATKPVVDELVSFKQFIAQDFEGQRFIAHCYTQQDIDGAASASATPEGVALEVSDEKPVLDNLIAADVPTLVMIGPEGDFSVEEVRLAQAAGFKSISLGACRLRTETAALMAVHSMAIKKRV